MLARRLFKDNWIKLFTVFLILGIVFIVFSNIQARKTLGSDIQYKKITVENIIKAGIEENYIFNRKRVEGFFDLENVIYSDVSYKYDKGNSKIINIYFVYKDYYEIVYVDANPLSTAIINIISDDNLINVYYSFIEYETVGAITFSENENIKFFDVFKSEITKRTDIVGGDVVKRVFKQEVQSNHKIEASFIIYNAYSYEEITNETRNFGTYKFIIN